MGSGLSIMTALRFGFPFHLPRPVNVCEDCGGAQTERPETEWITATAAAGANRLSWWLPDGNLLYLPSTRDDYSCIWHSGRRLAPATKRPRAEPMAVYHFHETRCSLNMAAGFISGHAAGGRIVFALAEQSGNIGLAEPGRQGIHCGDIR